LKGGRRLLCANLADLAHADAARDRGLAVAGAVGLPAMHLADPTPADVARGCDPAAADAAGLSVGHGPLRAARGPTAAIGLRWTCGPDSSASGQRQEQAVKSKLGNLHLILSATE